MVSDILVTALIRFLLSHHDQKTSLIKANSILIILFTYNSSLNKIKLKSHD